ncbi:MAG TPA: Na(+)-translocating NADH-quinone reductase subunit A [Vicinamibacteria bacterium]|nr:Na(+)-translocating NADH-quinone reductase subunit A [Vicinamibacteria bacterium]
MIRVRRGLDVPISGAPDQTIVSGPRVREVALLGDDYVGMRPRMHVELGERVKLGQALFSDKKTPGVQHTSPASGRVVAIHRGAKRKFESIVIALDGDDEETFESFSGVPPRDAVRRNLVASGLWTALRTRPFGRVPPPESVPHSIFVTAIDSRPLAADPVAVLEGLGGKRDELVRGLEALARLTDGPVYLCRRPGASFPGEDVERVSVREFEGPHPAGLPGTHIHFLDPVSERKTVWHVNYQDVVAIGHLFLTGRVWVERIVALGGPPVQSPALVRTRLGASTSDLLAGRLADGPVRVVSGSVLEGRTAAGVHGFLGRYHLQVSVISGVRARPFLDWLRPGFDKFSVKPVFASALVKPKRRFDFTTSSEGELGPIIPVGCYEKVVPLDLVPTALLKAIAVGDVDRARALGCLELDEEDLALCGFVCPGKNDYGPPLRSVLGTIEKEG